MRSVNRTAVLELIRQNSPIARSEIARQLGLSQPTVMRIVDELIPKMLVRYTGETEGTRVALGTYWSTIKRGGR
jgi:DNA-binding IclR family transcriptional regulator